MLTSTAVLVCASALVVDASRAESLADSGTVVSTGLPAPVVKCLLATVAGVVITLFGFVYEHVKEQANAVPGHSRLPLMNLTGKVPESKPAEPTKQASTPATVIKSDQPSVRWLPRSSQHTLSSAESTEKKVKGILNKLTEDKFDRLYMQLATCCKEAPVKSEVVGVVAREVFRKATMEHCFIDMYARVCKQLHEDLGAFEIDFKSVLLLHCKESFNEYLQPLHVDHSLEDEAQFEQRVKSKTKMLGNVRLIGQLLLKHMLNSKIIFHCADELFRVGSAECLETLSAFITTVAADFDVPGWAHASRLGEVFVRMELLTQDPAICPRIRCLLQDVLDKRQQGWPQAMALKAAPRSRSSGQVQLLALAHV